MTLENPGIKLQQIIDQLKPELNSITELESKVKRNPKKWSKREIIGHLIDSASNNHLRFVTGQTKKDLIFEGYSQEEWVSIQGHQELSWKNLIALWYYFNTHLASIIQNIPDEKLYFQHAEHNLDTIAWKRLSSNKPGTLIYLIWDYISHMEHHISQILKNYNPQIVDQY